MCRGEISDAAREDIEKGEKKKKREEEGEKRR